MVCVKAEAKELGTIDEIIVLICGGELANHATGPRNF